MARLNVNGKAYDVDVGPDTPLLWAIRENIGLTGTKYGCGIGQCGACTVLVNGQAMRACQTLMKAAAGKDITTIEGLAAAMGDKLQKAWREVNVPQCGYCQAGQMMQAASLLKKKSKPSDADIDSAMQGNICRCGTYGRILKAIKVAAGVSA